MKKFLLSLVAVLAALGSYAQYKVNDYIYTGTGKLKVTGLVNVPAYASWTGYSADLFSPYAAETDQDYNGILSLGSEETYQMSTTISLTYGKTYAVAFKVKGAADAESSVTADAKNEFNASVVSPDGAVSRSVASVAKWKAGEWTEVLWSFIDTLSVDGEEFEAANLKLLFGSVNADVVIADGLQVLEVEQVFDTRISDARFAFVEQLLAEPSFNTAAAADKAAALKAKVESLKAKFSAGSLDDFTTGEDSVASLDEVIEAYLAVESTDMAQYLKYIDIVSFPTIGRGRINSQQGCFPALGGNWGHLAGTDYLMSAIQNSFAHDATLTIVNDEFPAGKYYFTGEVRNANTNKVSWPCELTFDLSTDGVTATLGDATVTIDSVAGEQYKRFYVVGNVAKAGEFKATVYWPGVAKGGAFQVRNLQVRSFSKVDDAISRAQAWNKFVAQWNVAVEARQKTQALLADKNYPYGKDSLQAALDKWDPLFNKVLNVWVDAEGNDLNVASNEELEAWVEPQGFDPALDTDSVDIKAYGGKFYLVRGYQYANSYVEELNKPIANYLAVIAEAEAVLDEDMYSGADVDTRADFQEIIDESKDVLEDVLSRATNETREADEAELLMQADNLALAQKDFINRSTIDPFVDIDFANRFTTVIDADTLAAYEIVGVAGKMLFATTDNVQPDPAVQDNIFWQLGFNNDLPEVLRVGNTDAVVEFPAEQIPTDEDVIRADFDLWFGNLINRYMTIELRNAAGERVAGFSYSAYDDNVNYNDFDNEGHTGMVLSAKTVSKIGSSSAGDAAICVDKNLSSFSLVVDYKAQTVQGTLVNSDLGTTEGQPVALQTPESGDNKITQFVVTSTYVSAPARRCWFDNLKIFKYPSSAKGANDSVGVKSVDSVSAGDAAVYTLSGAKVNGLQRGINIVKGADGTVRKVFVK